MNFGRLALNDITIALRLLFFLRTLFFESKPFFISLSKQQVGLKKGTKGSTYI
jgi:hypothetical protein